MSDEYFLRQIRQIFPNFNDDVEYKHRPSPKKMSYSSIVKSGLDMRNNDKIRLLQTFVNEMYQCNCDCSFANILKKNRHRANSDMPIFWCIMISHLSRRYERIFDSLCKTNNPQLICQIVAESLKTYHLLPLSMRDVQRYKLIGSYCGDDTERLLCCNHLSLTDAEKFVLSKAQEKSNFTFTAHKTQQDVNK